MKAIIEIIKILIFPIFLILAFFRVKYDNSTMVIYVNLISCMLSIALIIATTQEFFCQKDKKDTVLISCQFINITAFLLLIVFQYQFDFINAVYSDALSIVALGAALSTVTCARVLKCILKWIFD